MTTISAVITIMISYSFSLKDKRQVRRSLIDKIKQKFNVSIAEVSTQHNHQLLTLGLAVVSSEYTHAKEMIDEVIKYIERNTDAEIINIEMNI